MPNLELEPKRNLSLFRRMALGTWRTAYDPSVYGTVEIRMDRALGYIEAFRQRTGKRLTVTHLVARAAAEALRQTPDANAILRFNRIYLRKRIGIFMQVAMTDQGPEKVDLSGVTVYDAADKSLAEIVDEVETRVAAVRRREDPDLERSRGLFRYIPFMLLGLFLRLISFLCYTLNLDLRRLGMPRDPFGSLMITNVGSLGLDTAYAPLVPYSRVPILLALGQVKPQPVAVDGEVAIRQVLKVNATFDHRFIDGVHAASMSRILRSWLEHPEEHFDPLPPDPAAAARAAPSAPPIAPS